MADNQITIVDHDEDRMDDVPAPAAKATLTRSTGLPADGSDAHYFGFDQQGGVWAIQWSREHECFVAVGWQGKWPSTLLLRGDARSTIASYVEEPIHLIDAA